MDKDQLPIKKQYDASGDDGRRGRDGEDAPPHPGSSSEQGYRGGDGTEGTKGQTGGSLRLRLFDPAGHERPARDVLGVIGELVLPGGRHEEVDDRLAVTPETEVFGDAHGGDGGDGGNGGRGGRGARGTRGDDATRHFSADDGGPGGMGGMGGAAACGRNPGAGGRVVFEVDFRDTDLAAKTRYDVRPGKAGRAGVPGPGGEGGCGGPGGSGTTWTETHTTIENGETVTKTESHSRPGGSRGPTGRPGPTNDEPVYDGEEQPPGTFAVVVTGADGRPLAEYREVYDLELLGFALRSRNLDGVFEPGEEILVTDLGGSRACVPR